MQTANSLKDLALAALVAAGLLAGAGARHAAADSPALDAPTMTNAQHTSQGGLRVNFVDHSEGETGFFIYVYPGYIPQGDSAGPLPIHAEAPPVAGSGQSGVLELTQDYWHFQPGTLYCVSLQAFKNPGPFQPDILSDESETVCAATAGTYVKPAPAPAPAQPDLAVLSITGPTTLQRGVSGTYTVTIKNQGGTTAPVELFIVFTGKLDQTGHLDPACELKPPDTGITASVRCSGSTLAPGETATVVVQARGQSAGAGKLVASINPSHTPAESSYDNNVTPPFTVAVS